ncbi:hypothetical protein C8R45DRAFT_635618 [Mycena sanguinolenta]|nr:hypothetical protein C8R45DRAFT_635618 [Mycena sanguinolenta]
MIQDDLEAIFTDSEMRREIRAAEGELCQLEKLVSVPPKPVSQPGDLELENKFRSLRIELAPHKKLPPELLAQIFFFCSPPTEVVLPPKSAHPLLTLTRICRAWRELALRIPEFWASISVTFTEEHNDVEHLTELSAQWLSRAGIEYPLSITAKCARNYGAATCENPGLFAPFASLIISHAHHLRHFHLEFPIAALFPLFELPHGAFPCLETIMLRPLVPLEDPNDSCWPIWPSTSVTFTSAPLVREISFCPIPCSPSQNWRIIARTVPLTAYFLPPEKMISTCFRSRFRPSCCPGRNSVSLGSQSLP